MSTVRHFRHTDVGQWSAEASDLGFSSGQWPKQIVADLDGFVCVATLVQLHESNGDTTHAEYRPFGRKLVLTVWND